MSVLPRLVVSLFLTIHSTAYAAENAEPVDTAPVKSVSAQNRDPHLRTADEERLLREFALHSYRHIAFDVLNGRGEYLQTLQFMLRSQCLSPERIKSWLQGLLAASSDAVDFSRRIATEQPAGC